MAYIGSKPANKPVVASDLDPTVITGQTALATSPASTDEFLISDAGVLKRLDASLIGGTNTPAFYAKSASNQSVSDNTNTKVTLGTEDFDSDGKFADSRFTPTVAGKYYIFGTIFCDPDTASDLVYGIAYIYKNGAAHNYAKIDFRNDKYIREVSVSISTIIDLDADDYVELYGNVNSNDGSGQMFTASNLTFFGGYKIIQ